MKTSEGVRDAMLRFYERLRGWRTTSGLQHGEVGWFVDEPTYTFPDGSRMRTRLSAVLQREGDIWRIGPTPRLAPRSRSSSSIGAAGTNS